MVSGFYSNEELLQIGLKSFGKNVKISKRASLYNCPNIEIGNNSRIDDFCILSAGENGISIGSNVHVACYTSLIGKGNIRLDDFANISSRVAIYSSNDDYSGNFLTGPTLPPEYTNMVHANVRIGKHVIIGTSTTILPGVTIHDGGAVGAYSLVTKDIERSVIAAGIPAKKIKDRSSEIFKLEKTFKDKYW